MSRKVRKGDSVQVMKGKDRGKQGEVQRILAKEQRLLVEGINMVKRHQRPRPGVQQGGIMTMEAPIHIANVRVVCAHCSRPARVGFTFLSDGKKVRYCKKCQETIE